MGFKCGIVGLPNVGKSTLFNALTKANIQAQNYPFCTIEPNIGIVPVPDPRLEQLASLVNPEHTIATTMEFVDIAGLVKGAAQGEGLGNKFLANIRETDAIAHVVRCFDNQDIIHVAGQVDPISDIDIINTELLLADIETVQKALQKINKLAKSGNKDSIAEQTLLQQLSDHLNNGKLASSFIIEPSSQLFLKNLCLLTVKPVMYIANVDEYGFTNNPYLTAVENFAAQQGALVVPICAELESQISELSDLEKKEFLTELNLEQPGLNRLIQAGYKLLNLQTYFTAGVKEVRAWTILANSTAPQAAGKIHSDFEKGFIRAEVISYNDFINFKGEQGAKDAGKWRLEGKDYIVQDGDIIHFRFNV